MLLSSLYWNGFSGHPRLGGLKCVTILACFTGTRLVNLDVISKSFPKDTVIWEINFWGWNIEPSVQFFNGLVLEHNGDLNSEHSNSKLIWIANFYLVCIQMVTDWMVWTIQLATMANSLITKCHSVTKLFTIPIANCVR